ncbi:MAG: DUF2090 domain-containing protein [Myxococcales bacterium]|nr:DUF2090 domain-containing protein [Myxococcales bacterium]
MESKTSLRFRSRSRSSTAWGSRPSGGSCLLHRRAHLWESLEAVVERRDPRCLGVLLLGNGLSAAELRARMALARNAPHCRGFAFGRTVFAEASRAWLRGDVDDAAMVARIRDRLMELIDLWCSNAV